MSDADRIRRQVAQRLEGLRRAGVTLLPHVQPFVAAATASSPKPDVVVPPFQTTASGMPDSRQGAHHSHPLSDVARNNTPTRTPPVRQGADQSPPTRAVGPSPSATGRTPIASGCDSLERIRADVAACTRCRELACSRTQTVFGVGNPQPRLCFLGEAPGADEDRQGEPFVGRAGQLLNKIIEACTLRREDVYILNILKCRPPGNRNPEPIEAENCRPFLDRQLALLKPEFICCLGAVAAKNLLKTETTIGKLRGRVLEYGGAKVVCTYHPAYLLRNPAAKRDTWEDMQMLMKLMGIQLPGG